MANALIGLAVNFLIQRGVAFFGKPPKFGAKYELRRLQTRQRVDVSYTGGVEPRRKLYGDFRAAGLDVMVSSVTGLTGTTLHRCYAMHDGEIESYDAINFNNDRIAAADFSGGAFGGSLILAGTARNGVIASGPYAGWARVHPWMGEASQIAEPAAAGIVPGWTSFHRGDGVAYLYMNFEFDPSVYPAGAPNVVVEGKGGKIYDPRLDTSPGANPTNPSYIAFSRNPALQLIDFLTWQSGGRESTSSIDWDDVVTAADLCDETVDIPGGETQNRYTSSTEVYAPLTVEERDKTIKMLARALMGVCWFSGGQWKMRAGSYTAPVGSIVDEDFVGDVNIATAQSRRQAGMYNTVGGTYVEQLENSQPKSFPRVSTPAYVTEDGEEITIDAEFTTARTKYEAQRNAIIMLRQSRSRLVITGTFRFKCWKFELYDIVTVTLEKIGWVAQTARITRMRLRQDFNVEMELTQVAATDYDDPDPSDYIDSEAIAPPVSSPYAPNAPRNLTATSQASAIIFTWDPPIGAPVGVLYQLFEYSSSTPFSSAVQVAPDTPQTSIVLPKSDTTVRYYWIRAVDPSTGAVGTQAPPSNGVPGSAATASSALGAIVTPGSASAFGQTSTLNTNEVTVTPTGGTAPYTYATTFTSGGTGISAVNGTTSSPEWTATGLAEGETRSGTARIRVTDNVAATFDVYVAVTITRGYEVTLNNTSVNASGGSMSAAVGSYTVANTRVVAWNPPGSTYDWLGAGGDPADYDVMFDTIDTPYTGSAATNTWLRLNVSRTIVNVRQPPEGAGTTTLNMTVRIRMHNSPFTELETCSVSMASTIN